MRSAPPVASPRAAHPQQQLAWIQHKVLLCSKGGAWLMRRGARLTREGARLIRDARHQSRYMYAIPPPSHGQHTQHRFASRRRGGKSARAHINSSLQPATLLVTALPCTPRSAHRQHAHVFQRRLRQRQGRGATCRGAGGRQAQLPGHGQAVDGTGGKMEGEGVGWLVRWRVGGRRRAAPDGLWMPALLDASNAARQRPASTNSAPGTAGGCLLALMY